MSLYEMAKDAAKAAQKADNIELVKKLLDVQNMALEMQNEAQKKNKLIEDLMLQVSNLKAEAALKGSVKFDDYGVAWINDEPFCGACYGSRNNLLRLKRQEGGYFLCPDSKNCGAGYESEEYQQGNASASVVEVDAPFFDRDMRF